MTITEADIQRILYGTEGVTEGSWTALRSIPQEGYDGWYLKVQPNAFMRGFTKEIGWINGGDENLSLASHIARCDPNTIRALCELAMDGLKYRAKESDA